MHMFRKTDCMGPLPIQYIVMPFVTCHLLFTNRLPRFPSMFCHPTVGSCNLLPTGSEQRKVLGVGSIPVAALPSCQNMKIIALQLYP